MILPTLVIFVMGTRIKRLFHYNMFSIKNPDTTRKVLSLAEFLSNIQPFSSVSVCVYIMWSQDLKDSSPNIISNTRRDIVFFSMWNEIQVIGKSLHSLKNVMLSRPVHAVWCILSYLRLLSKSLGLIFPLSTRFDSTAFL